MNARRPSAPADPELRWVLSRARTAGEACDAVCGVLSRRGLLVSVFLRQGDRLRCRGVRGYRQVFDGLPPVGLLGRTVETGRRTLLRDAPRSPDYLEAAPDVLDALFVPLRSGDAVVGVLSVEATAPLTAEQEAAVDDAAACLQTRLGELALPSESPAQKLGRHATALTTLAATEDAAAVLAAAVEAAVDISAMDSAALCLEQPGAGLAVAAATGPRGPALLSSPPEELAHLAAWVRSGSSCYSVGAVGEDSGAEVAGHAWMRTVGAASFVVLPLRMAGAARGMLVLAASWEHRPQTDEVELLELLAGTVVSCLEISDRVRALRDRADADALTGLGHHASFHATLPPARRSGPGARLAVLYVDVDHFKAVNDTRGHAAGDRLLVALSETMRAALRDDDRLFRIGGDEFAVLARVDTAEQAVALGERLLAEVGTATGSTLSVGVAIEEPDESDSTLLARADAAVYGAKAAGRARVHLATSPGTA